MSTELINLSWAIKLLAVSTTVIAACLVVGLFMLWDLLLLGEEAIKAIEAVAVAAQEAGQ